MIMKGILLAIGFLWLASFSGWEAQAQGTYAPLALSISGDGTVTPLQNGQSLEVGQDYEMEAIAAAGYVFSGWQLANFFTQVEVTLDPDGNPNPSTTSTVISLIPGYYSTASVLDFTGQDTSLIFNYPGVEQIYQSHGWQADFTPVPEPASATLIAIGAVALAMGRGKLKTMLCHSYNRFKLALFR
jgi:hypothetical protein